MSLHTPSTKRHALAAIRRMFPGTSCEAQCNRIREALSQFSLTTFEAMRFLDCYDPRARMTQIRRSGVAVDTHWQTIVTECGDRHRVGLYVLNPGRSQT